MPSASNAKLEKQASTEAVEPIKQGIVIIEHKIRNLEKRKLRLDGYKDLQKSGKELNTDQKFAVSKYDEVIQTLELARDLYKQFSSIAVDSAKLQKKQAKKEVAERNQQEIAKIRDILIVQDVLTNMGQDNIREDFLAGNNGALKLSEEDLKHLDDLFVEVSPKREVEEGLPPFPEQLQKSAEHLVNLVEGKAKEIVGTTYAHLKEQIMKISNCGYFEQGATPSVPEEREVPTAIVQEAQVTEDQVPCDSFQPRDEYTTIQHQPVETAGLFITQQPVNDVLSNVMNSVTSSFNFIQESELDTEVVTPTPPPATALPIPTQTFTNANYVAPPVNVSPAIQQPYPSQPDNIVYAPIPMPPQTQHIAAPITETAQKPVYSNPTQQYNSQTEFQHQMQSGDWSEDPVTATNDWAVESDQAGNWQNNESNDWNEQQNDGFVPAGGRVSGNRGYGRGGRGNDRPRGRDNNYSGQRGNRGGNYNNQNGRGGGNYYRNNDSGNNYYHQNGYQNRGDGERGYRESGYNKRGGSRGSGAPRQDRGERGGPRGGRGGNQRGGRGGGSRPQ